MHGACLNTYITFIVTANIFMVIRNVTSKVYKNIENVNLNHFTYIILGGNF